MFRKILIANRGEIACRIIRTAQRLGVATVAVYSEADAKARHVRLADEARAIGPAPARESYLHISRIIRAAQESGAEAVHPGYGFLSENAEFAAACTAAGLVFIGPPAAAITAMGDKAAAKARMAEAGVPVVPGYHGADQDPARLLNAAVRLGFPLLIKATAGGGGKGLRIVENAAAFPAALAACQREAKASFGHDEVLLEQYLVRPRHIEIQIFADRAGHCVHLFERDCSVQRRHQKIIEEAPAPGLTAARRQLMGEAAIAAARAVGYVGAGTVEFIVDQAGNFFFMEMNTRLQVEHPVTEMITGLDLVEWQLLIAAGADLPRTQAELKFHGHAIEVRLYAEDPARGFLPSSGRLESWTQPTASEHVRVDTGVEAGDEITPYYDPMIAKLIVWDVNREKARQRLRQALQQVQIEGISTNTAFLRQLADCPSFAHARLDTGLIEREQANLFPAVAAAAATAGPGTDARPQSPWALRDGFRLNVATTGRIQTAAPGRPRAKTQRDHGPDHSLLAPIPAKVVALLVSPGTQVTKGTPLVILEAMKMEMTILAPAAGVVSAFPFPVGTLVLEGAQLVDFIKQEAAS